jgi:RHS repeat-associated protein
VPAETVATFKNSLSSLIRVFYTYDTREEEYVYDVGGNRVRESITTRGTGIREYHYYPNTNRLMTDGTYAYTYDPNGNIIAKGTHILINSETAAVTTVASDYWNTNRLTKVHKNGEEAAAYSYNYNSEGLRIRKQKNDKSTWYAFSLSGKLIYKEKEEEQTFNNYIYTNGQLFAMEEGTLNEAETTRSYLHTDHLGSVVAATNIDGGIVWANDYTPFGETTGASGFNDEFAKFTGKEMDPDTGLYYFNARWYDPTLGRFITEDPIKDGLNWYGYCANNPLRYADPIGLRLDDDLETDLKRKDREEIELEPEKPKEPDVNSDPWGVKKAFNLDFGLDHMNDAAWFYSQGKIVRGLLSNTAGAAEAAYDLAAAYVAAQVLGVVTATASTKTEGLLQRAISGIKRGFQSVFGRTTGDAGGLQINRNLVNIL